MCFIFPCFKLSFNMERLVNIIHRVKKNETLTQICDYYKVSQAEIKKLNNITEIWEGACLFIPQKNKALYIVQPADTIKSICEKFNITEEELKKKNNITAIFIGMQLKI